MRAHQIMTRHVVGISAQTPIAEAANIMLRCHVSGLPVIDDKGALKGIISEGDFLRRREIGTERRRSAWLEFFAGVGTAATDFVHECGRKVEDVMTANPVTIDEQTPLAEIVQLMQKHRVKRLPVMNGPALVGIITRADILRAVATLAHEIPDPTADDDHIREHISREVYATAWRPAGFQVQVRGGDVHLYGVIFDERARRAAVELAEATSGVKNVHDHLCFVDGYSGFYVASPEDIKAAS
ncbi:CBS domain-containing protein [Bradyrhizobium tropiciagri]|uniref:CBS domain-containing protein n=1 Tax=Bradyrhizobium tropiciagri TaxID=312253 RepID=UPI001BAD328F|nr:CBS domain-containing protein [Bradyrhizobium tropiciagri]MBR0900666.1 CBS domain-containing protein [Bradyrhizobium tropiciagri]